MSPDQTLDRLPSVVAPPTIAFHPEGAETPEGLRSLPCPNCGDGAAKALVLTVDVQLPDNPAKRLRVLRCSACRAHFYDSQVPPDYAEPALNNRGRVPFYVQQGAGVSLITKPLAQLPRPAGASYMEVGCGYGFGLDFALNTKGWTGLGIDPAPLAALGRDALGLPIELRYLRDDDEARGTIDVVLGSEVIEHVPSPAAFVRTLRAMLRPGGVLILTTPNGDDIDPGVPPGIIIPLLSPSLHLVIQNRHSLSTLLRQAGFAHVAVEIDSHSLVAFASDAALDLVEDRDVLRRVFRDHLERRARVVDKRSDLFLAFAGRAFCESVNDGDMDAADRAWALLVPGVRERFGLGLEGMAALPPAVGRCSLEEMATLVPLNLGSILYARGIRQIAAGAARAGLEGLFLLAAEAAASMRRALGELAMEDGQTEEIGWTATAEAVLCAAAAGDAGVAERLRALPPAPNGGERRRMSVALRAMTGMVNAGRLAEGRALVRGLGLDAAGFAAAGAERTEAEQDALYCLAVLDGAIGADGAAEGDPALAATRFGEVRRAAGPGSALWWSALRGEAQALRLAGRDEDGAALAAVAEREHPGPASAAWAVVHLVNLGRHEAARALATRSGVAAAPAGDGAPDAGERELLFGLAMLDIGVGTEGEALGNPRLGLARLGRLRRHSAAGTADWWAAVRGEAQALALLRDADGARALVDGVLREAPGAEGAAWALPRLVDAGRLEEARVVAARSGLAAAGDAGRPVELVLALARLDAAGGEAGRARARFRAVRGGVPGGSGTWWAALRGEAEVLTGDGAGLAALVQDAERGLAGGGREGSALARWAVPQLVNAGHYGAARALARRSGLAAEGFAQPDGRGTLSAEERDLVFFLAVLDAEIGADGRAAGEPAMARGRFARVRRASAEGADLWWAALRGELQALDLLDAQEEAAELTRDVEAGHPHLVMPADILARIGKG